MHERIGIAAVESQVEHGLGVGEVVLPEVVVEPGAGAAEVGYPRAAADARAWEGGGGQMMYYDSIEKKRDQNHLFIGRIAKEYAVAFG